MYHIAIEADGLQGQAGEQATPNSDHDNFRHNSFSKGWAAHLCLIGNAVTISQLIVHYVH